MELAKVIRKLRGELREVKKAIAVLEKALRNQAATPAPVRRGRRSMGPEERRQVSQRMKLYWAARRGKQSD